MKDIPAFKVKKNGKVLDYRIGDRIDLSQVRLFFEQKGYIVKNLKYATRHVTGILIKNSKSLFLKLSTSEGVGVLTENEAEWNKIFNKQITRKDSQFWVPQTISQGLFKEKYSYFLTDYFNGTLLVEKPDPQVNTQLLEASLIKVLKLTEQIQKLKFKKALIREHNNKDFRSFFLYKTKTWYKSIPKKIRSKKKVNNLYKFVVENAYKLQKAPRHGDFAPWHIMKLENDKFLLFDGEHASSKGVLYYDICFFIERVYSVLEKPKLAKKIYSMCQEREYDKEQMRIILAARAIGGFLDESLAPKPNYTQATLFADWTLS
jgi:hypothetical protein